jgi:signal transduction histidine kinase
MKKAVFLFLFLICATAAFSQPADSLMSVIFDHYDKGEYVEVINYSQKAISFFEEQDDLFNLAGCYNMLGTAYQRTGELEKAINSYQRCCDLMDELKKNDETNDIFFEKNKRYTYNNIAAIYYDMGEYSQAEKMFQKCMEMLGEPMDTIDFLDKATYLQNLTQIYLKEAETLVGKEKDDKLKTAIEMMEQSLDYSSRYGDWIFKRVNRMIILSQAYAMSGRMEEANAQAEEAMNIAETWEDALLQTQVNSFYGFLYKEQHEYQKAEQSYMKAVELARKGQYKEEELKALEGAYDAAKYFDKEKALEYLEQSVVIKENIYNEKQQQFIRDYQVKYDLNEKDHQLEIQEQENKRNRHLAIVLLIVAALLFALLLIWIRMNQIKKNQNRTLRHISEVKDHLLQVVSHDLKTSVIAQNMVLDQMYQHCGSMEETELRENLLALKTSSDGMKEKLINVMQWIMSELGGKENHPVHFNLLKQINTCVNAQSVEIKTKEISLHIDVNPDLECNDDTNIFSIVFQNLLSNAIKFSEPKGEIFITAMEDGSRVWVSVTDKGIGIPKEKLQILSNDIVSPTQGTAGELGTGLGLLVCRRLLSGNGAELFIESKAGETTVRFNVKKW